MPDLMYGETGLEAHTWKVLFFLFFGNPTSGLTERGALNARRKSDPEALEALSTGSAYFSDQKKKRIFLRIARRGTSPNREGEGGRSYYFLKRKEGFWSAPIASFICVS
jgi:hypothetical protein